MISSKMDILNKMIILHIRTSLVSKTWQADGLHG
jgi:hypothetical protein